MRKPRAVGRGDQQAAVVGAQVQRREHDPVFANTDAWWQSIPAEVRPHKDQPFYHLLAENDQGSHVAYVSEQNLLPDDSDEPVGHPQTALIFDEFKPGRYQLRPRVTH
jgi:heat shock protein HspQ